MLERRRWSRVPLDHMSSAVIRSGERTFKVLDLGYGGLAFSMRLPKEAVGKPLSIIPLRFNAEVWVPFLAMRVVTLCCLYAERDSSSGLARIGCYFAS
jgi:hypothetical protein